MNTYSYPNVMIIEYLESTMSKHLLCKFPDNSAFDFDYTQSAIWSPLVPRPPSSSAVRSALNLDLSKGLSYDDDMSLFGNVATGDGVTTGGCGRGGANFKEQSNSSIWSPLMPRSLSSPVVYSGLNLDPSRELSHENVSLFEDAVAGGGSMGCDSADTDTSKKVNQDSIWSPLVPHPPVSSSVVPRTLSLGLLSYEDDVSLFGNGIVAGGGVSTGCGGAATLKEVSGKIKRKLCNALFDNLKKYQKLKKRNKRAFDFSPIPSSSSSSKLASGTHPTPRKGWGKVLKAASKHFKKKKKKGSTGHLSLSNCITDDNSLSRSSTYP